MQTRHHWQQVYLDKPSDTVSWYQADASRSLQLIDAAGLDPDAPIIDVGGGASVLVDQLLARGHRDVTVLDLADSALQVARERLAGSADAVQWLQADITSAALPAGRYALWHDRAVFHFLTEPSQRAAYRERLLRALRGDGHVVIATFADDGPTRCSGLPVCRYSADALQAQFGDAFELRATARECHRTPSGSEQAFVYLHLQRRAR